MNLLSGEGDMEMLDRSRNGDMPNVAYKEQYEREKTLWLKEKIAFENDGLRMKKAASGAADMLREAAKQFRAIGDDGHAAMCDRHADQLGNA